MSEFEYSNLSSDNSSDEELVTQVFTQKKKPDINTIKVRKELQLHYSNLFIDSFTLIDLFVKSKKLTYNSFLEYFESTNFHQIYTKHKFESKHVSVSPHHFITTTQDALAVASKFLRSHSREARIGAVYLLFTLYRTQPLKTYLINVKMEPKDYHNTKELVKEYLNEGLTHPAYCFYDLDIKRRITITASTVNPCLEANYPRSEVRKHLGRMADKYFQIEYEERKDFDPFNKLQLMDHQMRNELAYIKKLSNLTLGHDAVPEYKSPLAEELVEISIHKKPDLVKINNETINTKKTRYKNKKHIAFPGKNENVLEDMVITTEVPNCDEEIFVHPKKKKRRKIGNYKKPSSMKVEPSSVKTEMQKLSAVIDSDSSCSSIESTDYTNTEDKYGDMIWRLLEGENEMSEQPSNAGEE